MATSTSSTVFLALSYQKLYTILHNFLHSLVDSQEVMKRKYTATYNDFDLFHVCPKDMSKN